MTAVPYRGGPEALTDVIAGRIDSTWTDFAAGMPQVREGKVRVLAVTSAKPFALAPEIPPVASVLPGYGFDFWFGMAAPGGDAGADHRPGQCGDEQGAGLRGIRR